MPERFAESTTSVATNVTDTQDAPRNLARDTVNPGGCARSTEDVPRGATDISDAPRRGARDAVKGEWSAERPKYVIGSAKSVLESVGEEEEREEVAEELVALDAVKLGEEPDAEPDAEEDVEEESLKDLEDAEDAEE